MLRFSGCNEKIPSDKLRRADSASNLPGARDKAESLLALHRTPMWDRLCYNPFLDITRSSLGMDQSIRIVMCIVCPFNRTLIARKPDSTKPINQPPPIGFPAKTKTLTLPPVLSTYKAELRATPR